LLSFSLFIYLFNQCDQKKKKNGPIHHSLY